MSMKIAKECKATSIIEGLRKLLHMTNDTMHGTVWVAPLPIKIHPREGAAVISVDYPIGVDHRDYFEDGPRAQSGGATAI